VAEAHVVLQLLETQIFILFYIPGSYADLHDQGGKSTGGMYFTFGLLLKSTGGIVVMMLKSVPGFLLQSCVLLDKSLCFSIL
jgi:hypothetical protein